MFIESQVRDRLVLPNVNKKMVSFKGQVCWAKTWGLGSRVSIPPDQKVNKAEEPTYLFKTIGENSASSGCSKQ